jgi:hypothetical protein
MSCPIVTDCFARAKSSTAGSVSLSDWLGRLPLLLLLRGQEAHLFANFGCAVGLSGLQRGVLVRLGNSLNLITIQNIIR